MLIEDKREIIRRIFSREGKHNSSLIRDFYRIKDNAMECDSTKLDAIIKKAEENSNKVSLFNEFLGTSILDQSVNMKIFPKYKKSILCVSSDKIIDNKFDIIQKLWFGYADNLESSQNEEVQIALDKTQNVLTKGYIFLEDRESKKHIIFGVDFIDGWMSGYIAIYSNTIDSSYVSGIMKEILNEAITNNFFKGAKITPQGKFLKVDNVSMDDIILKDEIKRRITSGTIDMFNNIDTYKKNNVPIKRGILMEGIPGTGKTLVAKALCNQINSTFVWVTADDIIYPEDISSVYDMARELTPTIILFEDIDYIGKSRVRGDGGSYDKITGELLNQMDGVESNEGIITLASSNYPKALDKALRNRPGRFDIRVRFDLPDAELRKKMFIKFMDGIEYLEEDIKGFIEMTNGWTGAYIKELVVSAKMLAIEDKSISSDSIAIVLEKHLLEAYDQINKSKKLDNIQEE